MHIVEILIRKITCQDMSFWSFLIMQDAILRTKKMNFTKNSLVGIEPTLILFAGLSKLDT